VTTDDYEKGCPHPTNVFGCCLTAKVIPSMTQRFKFQLQGCW